MAFQKGSDENSQKLTGWWEDWGGVEEPFQQNVGAKDNWRWESFEPVWGSVTVILVAGMCLSSSYFKV